MRNALSSYLSLHPNSNKPQNTRDSSFFKYQKEYYKAIAVSGGKAGCTPFVEFILGVIAETLTTQETTRKTTQEIILEAIARNPSITRAELAEVVGISPDGVKYHLQKLTKLGRLKRVGSTRRGEWVIE